MHRQTAENTAITTQLYNVITSRRIPDSAVKNFNDIILGYWEFSSNAPEFPRRKERKSLFRRRDLSARPTL